jgi:cysteine synthase
VCLVGNLSCSRWEGHEGFVSSNDAKGERASGVYPDEFYYADQFHNSDALPGYASLGEEILAQFPGGIDAFCGAAGSGGMLMGVSSVLRTKRPETRIVVLEPASLPVISEGGAGVHGFEGIAPGFVPPHLAREMYDEAWGIDEARRGLCVGDSPGKKAFSCRDVDWAECRCCCEIGKGARPGKTVVTIACDSGLKYLNGDLLADS